MRKSMNIFNLEDYAESALPNDTFNIRDFAKREFDLDEVNEILVEKCVEDYEEVFDYLGVSTVAQENYRLRDELRERDWKFLHTITKKGVSLIKVWDTPIVENGVEREQTNLDEVLVVVDSDNYYALTNKHVWELINNTIDENLTEKLRR